jgi:site-specific recombinase XerD
MTDVEVYRSTTPALADDMAGARALLARSRAESTLAAYRRDWSRFTAWADDRGLDAERARPDDVAAYVAHLVELGRKPATIERAVVSISVAMKSLGRVDDNPTRAEVVRQVLAGMRRTLGAAQKKARPLGTAELTRLVSGCPPTRAGLRDRALLLLGFTAALRRSEVAALNVEDVLVVDDRGLEVTVRRSKTDQEGEGAVIPVRAASDPTCCPVRAWQAWRETLAYDEGPAWRSIDRHGHVGRRLSDRAVTLILDRAAGAAGVTRDRLSAHSLRAGYVTTAAQRGHSERKIANVSRHKSMPVLRGYIRRATVWDDAATDLGL